MKLLLTLILLISYISFSYGGNGGGGGNNSCGNYPYTLSKNNATVLDRNGNKIDIDRVNQRVLFTIKYPDEFEPRVVSIPVEGIENSSSELIKTQGTLYGQSTYQVIRGLYQFVGPISERLVINREVRIAGSTSNIFFPNNTFGNELTWTIPGNFIFEEENDIQYTCWPYANKIFKGSIGTYNDLGETIYNGHCAQMENNGNDLYIFDGSNSIYLGQLDASNNGTLIEDLPLFCNDSTALSIKEFDVSSTDLYYSNSIDKKIYSVPLSNPYGEKKVILNDIPTSFKYFNGFIYYSLNGTISRISINSNSEPEILFESSSSESNCICAQGFSGSKCDQCDTNNNIISWVSGVPRCIPLNDQGNPITCNYDYQCKDSTCSIIPISGGNYGC